jgi:hypothetical protein
MNRHARFIGSLLPCPASKSFAGQGFDVEVKMLGFCDLYQKKTQQNKTDFVYEMRYVRLSG